MKILKSYGFILDGQGSELKFQYFLESAEKVREYTDIKLISQNETMMKELLEQLDQWTKQGNRTAVLAKLTELLPAKLPEEDLVKLSQIANRNHAPLLGLRILYKMIKKVREKNGSVAPDVAITYANALLAIGALEEAQDCLVMAKKSNQALLSQAFICFAKWDYQKSLPFLMKYINSSETSDYQRLVGEVNLAASLTALGRRDQARQLLRTLHEKLKANENFKLLYGNSQELMAQVYLQELNFSAAEFHLNEAQQILSTQPGRYLLFVEKWKAVLRLERDAENLQNRLELINVKLKAKVLKNWETIRDCDFHLARITKNEELLKRVMWGTPYEAFRNRIWAVYGITPPESKSFSYCPDMVSDEPKSILLDLSQPYRALPSNQTLAKLMQMMMRDIYHPPRMGIVFSSLYPNTYFDPFSSPQRVHNTVFRFNRWTERSDLPFQIHVVDGDFLLTGPPQSGLVFNYQTRILETWELGLQAMKEKFIGRSFNSVAMASHLGVSQRSASEILQQALKKKRIQKFGRGKNTSYMFFSGASLKVK